MSEDNGQQSCNVVGKLELRLAIMYEDNGQQSDNLIDYKWI